MSFDLYLDLNLNFVILLQIGSKLIVERDFGILLIFCSLLEEIVYHFSILVLFHLITWVLNLRELLLGLEGKKMKLVALKLKLVAQAVETQQNHTRLGTNRIASGAKYSDPGQQGIHSELK